MRMRRNVGSLQTHGVHHRRNAVRRRLQTGVEVRHPLRLTHVDKINRVNLYKARKKSDILPPVAARPHQTVQQQQRTSFPGLLVVNSNPVHNNKRVVYGNTGVVFGSKGVIN